ncbi:hypothetical protein MNEG_8329 [Monoraphidium neglectum]|uniref:Uncharacterized protein n=1 Tax=Monoraphidium neglectum TaxID=145388 RepID=A0A0D2KWI9_9CHLO|nr:hypothetical protein MNEG_8329 [Monoraphidium neglectum]KIY99633.1 hypothetical protein MNEG_8329 [Monoraphidium neglectum]|eukprot:XP_013898653.1 hypothetical protein MNEG_8329 [Monoraphidium neglectum]
MQQARPALLGAVFPGRTLLIKKLRKAVGPSPAQLEQQRQQRLAQRSQEQLARAELRSTRREASRRWLAEVVAAAQGQRVGELVAALSRHDQLWQAKAASVGRGGGGGAGGERVRLFRGGARASSHPDRPGLPGHAALLAARHLADPRRGGSARHAQAFVELLIERGQVAPRRARSAVHAVLQAYDREGDLSKMVAAASRIYDTGDPSSPCLMPGARPPPSTLALLLTACGRAGNADLLAGVWRHLGPRHGAEGAGGGGSASAGDAPAAAPMNLSVVRAYVEAAVECDMRAAGLAGGSGGDGWTDADVHTAAGGRRRGAGDVGRALFGDGSVAEALYELQDWAPPRRQQHQQQQQKDPQRRQREAKGGGGAAAPVAAAPAPPPPPPLLPPLISPRAALPLLRRCSSVADVDALLLSRLLRPGGMSLEHLRRFGRQRPSERRADGDGSGGALGAAVMRTEDPYPISELVTMALAAQAAKGPAAADQQAQQQQQKQQRDGDQRGHGGRAAAAAQAAARAGQQPVLFPPRLPPPLAAAAVAAYMRFGASARAAAR